MLYTCPILFLYWYLFIYEKSNRQATTTTNSKLFFISTLVFTVAHAQILHSKNRSSFALGSFLKFLIIFVLFVDASASYCFACLHYPWKLWTNYNINFLFLISACRYKKWGQKSHLDCLRSLFLIFFQSVITATRFQNYVTLIFVLLQ